MSRNASPSSSASWFVPLNVAHPKKCSTCEEEVTIERTITCEKCKNEYHITCTELPTYELIKYFKKNIYKRKYTCKDCVLKLYPKDGEAVEESRRPCEQKKATAKSESDLLRGLQEEIAAKNRKIEELAKYIEEVNRERPADALQDDDEATRLEFVEEVKALIKEETKELLKSFDNRLKKMEEANDVNRLDVKVVQEESIQQTRPAKESPVKQVTNEPANQQPTHEEKDNFMDKIKSLVSEEAEKAINRRNEREQNERIQNERAPIDRPQGYRYPRYASGRRPTCFCCGRPGHIARQCYYNIDYPQNNTRRGNMRFNYNRGPRVPRRANPQTTNIDIERYRTQQVNNGDGTFSFVPLHQMQSVENLQAPQQQTEPPLQYYQANPPNTQADINKNGTAVYGQPLYRPFSYPRIPPTNF